MNPEEEKTEFLKSEASSGKDEKLKDKEGTHVENPDEAEDALETELFELRKSILAKPLLKLTLRPKLARLEQLAAVAEHLQLDAGTEQIPFHFDLVHPDEVLVLWEAYMKAKSQWKIAFTQVQTPRGMAALLNRGLELELAFSEQFRVADWTDEEPVFGVEPDPMPVQNGLKKAFQNGWITFSDLEKNKSALEKELLLAIKRLSLLPKYLK